jgi:hypothetical protein
MQEACVYFPVCGDLKGVLIDDEASQFLLVGLKNINAEGIDGEVIL